MRIRSIKPEFFSHEGLCSLSPLHRLLFQGLWCLSDRVGVLKDSPRRIKVRILPFDDCDVNAMLDDLQNFKNLDTGESEPFIHRYQVEGERYIYIPNFLEHQRPHYKEPKSTLPLPKKTKGWKVHDQSIMERPGSAGHGNSGASPNFSVPGTLGREGKGREGKGREVVGGAAEAPPPPTSDDVAPPSPSLTVKTILDRWNAVKGAKAIDFRKLTPDRGLHKRISVLLRNHADAEWWDGLFAMIEKIQPFLFSGENDLSWTAGLDWVLKPENLAKVLEGRYVNWKPKSQFVPKTAVPAVMPPPQPKRRTCNWHTDGTVCMGEVRITMGDRRRCGFHSWCEQHERLGTREDFDAYCAGKVDDEAKEKAWDKLNAREMRA